MRRIIAILLCVETLLIVIAWGLGENVMLPVVSWFTIATFYVISNELDRKD